MLQSEYAQKFLSLEFLKGAGGHEHKVHARESLLTSSPHLRIRISTPPLKEIVDYDRFVCHCNSSVAHDRAVNGGDIDVGLIITETPVSEMQRRNFTDELKKQGFHVLHPDEVQSDTDKHFVLAFYTHDELLFLKEELGGAAIQHMIVATYYGGFDIDKNNKPPRQDEAVSEYFANKYRPFGSISSTDRVIFTIPGS